MVSSPLHDSSPNGAPDETPPLSADSIAAAAERLVRGEGLRALTMRRLGRELGVEAMSLYHHVANKRDIEETLVARVLERVGAGATDSPVDAIDAFARSLLAVLAGHLALVPLIASVPADRLRENPAGRLAADRLTAAGFDPLAATWIIDAVAGFVLGHAGVVAIAPERTEHHEAVFETGLRFLLAGLREELGWDA